MKFGIEKCAMLLMKKEKRKTIERAELPNQESNSSGKNTRNTGYGHCQSNRDEIFLLSLLR